jgi:hypothetical protein
MAGYMAAMRIERVQVRGGVVARRLTPDPGRARPQEAPVVVELAGLDPGARLRERLDGIRTYAGQLTWYLFNAEGWR